MKFSNQYRWIHTNTHARPPIIRPMKFKCLFQKQNEDKTVVLFKWCHSLAHILFLFHLKYLYKQFVVLLILTNNK